MQGTALQPENTKILNGLVSISGRSKSNQGGTGHFSLVHNIRTVCKMFWKPPKCVLNVVTEWGSDLGRGDLSWVLPEKLFM